MKADQIKLEPFVMIRLKLILHVRCSKPLKSSEDDDDSISDYVMLIMLIRVFRLVKYGTMTS